MSPDSTRNWMRTYVAVIGVEVLVVWFLWLFSRHFSY